MLSADIVRGRIHPCVIKLIHYLTLRFTPDRVNEGHIENHTLIDDRACKLHVIILSNFTRHVTSRQKQI